MTLWECPSCPACGGGSGPLHAPVPRVFQVAQPQQVRDRRVNVAAVAVSQQPLGVGDGSLGKRLGQLARLDLLILDDFGIAPIAAHERNDLLDRKSVV